MKKLFNKKNNLIIIIILLLMISLFNMKSYARYMTNLTDISEIGIASYGNLTLVEKLNGVIQENNLESDNIINLDIEIGKDLEKEVYLEFTGSDVSAYLFLIVEGVNWQYDDTIKEFYILNNNSRVMYFKLNDIWNYYESKSLENKFVFYYEYDVNNNDLVKFDVINKIIPNIVCYSDIEFINNSELRFSSYSIQKNNNLTIDSSFSLLNID